MIKTKKRKKYQNIFSKVSTEISLTEYSLPKVNDVHSIGHFLKSIRLYLIEAYGRKYPKTFTQAGVAEYMGYSTAQYIYIVERGEVEPSLELCAKLAEYYAIPMDYMYDLLLEIRSREYKQALLNQNKEKSGS